MSDQGRPFDFIAACISLSVDPGAKVFANRLNSMNRHCAAVIGAQGGQTRYWPYVLKLGRNVQWNYQDIVDNISMSSA